MKPQYKILEIFELGQHMRLKYKSEEQEERAANFKGSETQKKSMFYSVFYCSPEVAAGDYLGAIKQFTDWIHTRGGEVVADFTMDR